MKTTLTALFILTMTLTGCSICKKQGEKQTLENDYIYDKQWRLTELNGQSIAGKINEKEPFISFNSKNNRYSASGGCNGLGGTFEIKSNNITFSQGMSTMMACPDMSVENGYRDLFSQKVRFKITGDSLLGHAELIFTRGNTILARFTNTDNVAKNELSGTWELDYISGPRIAFEGLYPHKKPTLKFDTGKGTINGNGSCNNYSGSFKTDNNQISFGPIASTKMACPENNGEDLYSQTLKKVNSYSVSESQLTFIMGDIAIMRFKRI